MDFSCSAWQAPPPLLPRVCRRDARLEQAAAAAAPGGRGILGGWGTRVDSLGRRQGAVGRGWRGDVPGAAREPATTGARAVGDSASN